MDKFNLQDAINGAEIVTRAGELMVFGAYNEHAHPSYRVMGWVNGKGWYWGEDGRYLSTMDTETDLFMSNKHYVNIHKDEIGMWVDERIYENFNDAVECGRLSNTYHGTNNIEI